MRKDKPKLPLKIRLVIILLWIIVVVIISVIAYYAIDSSLSADLVKDQYVNGNEKFVTSDGFRKVFGQDVFDEAEIDPNSTIAEVIEKSQSLGAGFKGGKGSGGEVVATIGKNIPVYSDSSRSGGTFVDVRAAYEDKGVSDYNNWGNYMYSCSSTRWPNNANIKACNGPRDVDGTLFDSDDRVLVAVGPGVMNPGRNSMSDASGSEMRYGANIDVVLEKGGNNYYIHASVGDCKAHTYPTGIIQTGYAVKGGKLYYTAPGYKDNYSTPSTYDKSKAKAYGSHGVVEFCKIGDNNTSGFKDYNIVGIIVY